MVHTQLSQFPHPCSGAVTSSVAGSRRWVGGVEGLSRVREWHTCFPLRHPADPGDDLMEVTLRCLQHLKMRVQCGLVVAHSVPGHSFHH